ncbi:MAG TPA: hypothetical protein P5511_00270 [Candidatus Goldiibacteriota bacterium]|nr:hypothetical protein [Candidatus Goldiibacteriota bacterium]
MKKFALKMAVFFWLVLLFQIIIGYAAMPEKVSLFWSYIDRGIDCLYFSDSVMRFYNPGDESSDAIIDIMKAKAKNYTIETVEHPGYNLEIYESYIRAAVKSQKKPRAVIIPVSLYSLSAEWDRPGYKFPLEQEALKGRGIINTAAYRIAASLRKKPASAGKYLEKPVYAGEKQEGIQADYEGKKFSVYSDENFRKKIISRYMHKAGPQNTRIQALKKILLLLKGSGIKAVIYIQPLDHETCSAFYGRGFDDNIRGNVLYIREQCAGVEGIFLDYSKLLKSEMFAWKDTMYVNEHINYRGKYRLAEALSRELYALLGD